MAKIKIDNDLFEKLKKYTEVAGYSSVYEFVIHPLESAISQFDEADSDEEIKNRLKGLGYLE